MKITHVRFYASDWRSGTIPLSLEEEGLYIRICAYQWETGNRVPLDDRDAACALGLDVRQWRRVRNQLVQKGKLHVADQGYYVRRAEHEYQRALRAAAELGTEPQETEETEIVAVGAARRADDRQHQDRRGSLARRQPARAPFLTDIAEKSPRLPPEVSDNSAVTDVAPATVRGEVPSKSLESVRDRAEKSEQNQRALNELRSEREYNNIYLSQDNSQKLPPFSSPLMPHAKGARPTHVPATPDVRTTSPRPRGTRLDPAWQLPDDWRAWTRLHFATVSPADIDLEADRFRDYWCAKTGHGATKCDWQATWRNWCRTAFAARPATVRRRDPITPDGVQPYGRRRGVMDVLREEAARAAQAELAS